MAARIVQTIAPNAAWTLPAVSVAAGAAIATWGVVSGYPGVAAVWAAFIVAGYLTQAPTFTGPADSTKRPTASGAVEETGMNRYRMWEQLRWRMFVPSFDWLPFDPATATLPKTARAWLTGIPVAGSWLWALVAAAAAWTLPLSDEMAGYAAINAGAAFITVAQVAAAQRRSREPAHPQPAVGTDNFIALAKENRSLALGLAIGGAAAGAIGALVTLYFTPASFTHRIALAGAVMAALPLAVVSRPLCTWALASWHELVDTDAQWKQRWPVLKKDPAPGLIAHTTLGVATVDTFRAPAVFGSATFLDPKIRDQIVNTIGSGVQVDILAVPNKDASGQDMPGTSHPLEFQIITWPTAAEFDLGAADCEGGEDFLRLALTCSAARYADIQKTGRPVLEDIEAMEPSDDHPGRVCYFTSWIFPGGGGYDTLAAGEEFISGDLSTGFLANRHKNCVYTGDLDAAASHVEGDIADLQLDRHWKGVWFKALKQNMAAPLVQPRACSEAKLADGTVIECSMFAVGQGLEPATYFAADLTLPTSFDALFVAVTGFQAAAGGRDGERHKQGLAVLHSAGRVPTTPQALAPSPGRGREVNLAQKWAIAGMINRAFREAKLARPEVTAVTPLTSPRSRSHIWEITLRLYDGVTPAQVRAKMAVIAQTWGSGWLRIGPAGTDGITIFAGSLSSASGVTLANPEADEFRITALDWEQAWADSKVVSYTTGETPRMLAVERMPRNQLVKMLDFNLPQGVSIEQAKAAAGKLKVSSGNSFLEFRLGVKGPTSIRVLASEEEPLPRMVPFDFDYADKVDGFPFGTVVDGEAAVFKLKDDAHVTIIGSSGAGKTVTAQGLIYSARIKGALPVIVDPTKGCADFKFAEEYSIGFATTVAEAAATMEAVYTEVVRRKNLNAKYGAASYKDLPDAPPPIVVFIDEFTSLLGGKKPEQRVEDDPRMEAQRQEQIVDYKARRNIAFYAGKIGREARSAGVHLFLMTQKLIVANLPPELTDVKDLAMDTRIPVPVSARFPSGWALNSELEIGDLLYTPAGHTAPAVGFSEVFTRNDVFEVTFDDSQVIRAGGQHLWSVSDHGETCGQAADPERAAWVRAAAAMLPVGTWAGAEDIASLVGDLTPEAVGSYASTFGLDAMLAGPRGALTPVPRGSVDESAAYEVTEFCTRLADHLESGDGARVVSTQEMADALASGGDHEWSIALPEAFDVPDVDLPVDPYKLGASATSPIAPIYLRASRSQRLALLQGLMDSRGFIADGYGVFTNGDADLMEQVTELTRSLGIKSIQDRAESVTFPADLLSQQRLAPSGRAARRYIRSITPIESVPTRCIAVDDPGHLFLVEGFIPTHNTNMARILIGPSTFSERMSALRNAEGCPDLGNEVPKGRGVWESTVVTAASTVQFWYAPAADFTANLAERVEKVTPEDLLDITPYLPQAPTHFGVVDDDDDFEYEEDENDEDEVVEVIDAPAFDLAALMAFAAPAVAEPETESVEPELEAESAEPEPLEPSELRDMTGADAAVFLDVDGVVAPFAGLLAGLPDAETIPMPGSGSVVYSPAVVAAVGDLPARVVWLTDREDDAPTTWNARLGQLAAHLEPETTEPVNGWWKLDALAEFLADNPGVRRAIWWDDKSGDLDELGITFAEIALDIARQAGVDLLIPAVDGEQGLTLDDVEAARLFLAGEPAADAEVPLAAPWEPEAPAPVDDVKPEVAVELEVVVAAVSAIDVEPKLAAPAAPILATADHDGWNDLAPVVARPNRRRPGAAAAPATVEPTAPARAVAVVPTVQAPADDGWDDPLPLAPVRTLAAVVDDDSWDMT